MPFPCAFALVLLIVSVFCPVFALGSSRIGSFSLCFINIMIHGHHVRLRVVNSCRVSITKRPAGPGTCDFSRLRAGLRLILRVGA